MSKAICTQVDYDDLSEKEQENQPNNGSGKEYASYLRVEFPVGDVTYYSDAMEPEDARFYRDIGWVRPVINEIHDTLQAENDRLREALERITAKQPFRTDQNLHWQEGYMDACKKFQPIAFAALNPDGKE